MFVVTFLHFYLGAIEDVTENTECDASQLDIEPVVETIGKHLNRSGYFRFLNIFKRKVSISLPMSLEIPWTFPRNELIVKL